MIEASHHLPARPARRRRRRDAATGSSSWPAPLPGETVTARDRRRARAADLGGDPSPGPRRRRSARCSALRRLRDAARRARALCRLEARASSTPFAMPGSTPTVDPLVAAPWRRPPPRHLPRPPRAGDGEPAIGSASWPPARMTSSPIHACPLLDARRSPGAPGGARHRAGAGPFGKPLDIQVTATESGPRRRRARPRPGQPSARPRLALLADAARPRPAFHARRRHRGTPPAVGDAWARRSSRPRRAASCRPPRPARTRSQRWCWRPVRQRQEVADLFAGVGPFALRIAERADRARGRDRRARRLLALDRAVRQHAGAAHRHHRAARPVPPAAARGRSWPASTPSCSIRRARAPRRRPGSSPHPSCPLVVDVSCNAPTFARTRACSSDGGYTLASVTPVDQFQHSAHVELVGVFRRTRRREAPRHAGSQDAAQPARQKRDDEPDG